jgi:hypothetical protein
LHHRHFPILLQIWVVPTCYIVLSRRSKKIRVNLLESLVADSFRGLLRLGLCKFLQFSRLRLPRHPTGTAFLPHSGGIDGSRFGRNRAERVPSTWAASPAAPWLTRIDPWSCQLRLRLPPGLPLRPRSVRLTGLRHIGLTRRPDSLAGKRTDIFYAWGGIGACLNVVHAEGKLESIACVKYPNLDF